MSKEYPESLTSYQRQLLWEQAIDDGASTGEFTPAHKLAAPLLSSMGIVPGTENILDPEAKSDLALFDVAHETSIEPTTVAEYKRIWKKLQGYSEDMSLTKDARSAIEQVRIEFEKAFPELDQEAIIEMITEHKNTGSI